MNDQSLEPPNESVVDRFLRYVRVDTQSREDASTTPSTPTQWTLAKLLAEELTSLGASDVSISDHCMVYATIPATIPEARAKSTPVLGLLAHVDTSPAVSGMAVKPTIHKNYQGGDIRLTGDTSQVLTVAQNPALADMIG